MEVELGNAEVVIILVVFYFDLFNGLKKSIYSSDFVDGLVTLYGVLDN